MNRRSWSLLPCLVSTWLLASPGATVIAEEADRELPAIALWGPFGDAAGAGREAGEQMRAAARIALRRGEARLGVKARLVEGSELGPWGIASQRLVKLIYDERPVALVGPTDSGRAHLGLQLATRARLPVLSPVATDATLTGAGTPWIFSLVPDERARACAALDLVRELGRRRVGLVFAPGRVRKTARVAIELEAEKRGLVTREVGGLALAHRGSTAPAAGEDPPAASRTLALELAEGPLDSLGALLVFCDAGSAPGSRLLIGEEVARRLPAGLPIILSSPLEPPPRGVKDFAFHAIDDRSRPESASGEAEEGRAAFEAALRKELDLPVEKPLLPLSARTHDAVFAVLEALGEVGPDRLSIREHLLKTSRRGSSGQLFFRASGALASRPGTFIRSEGRWIPRAPSKP